MNALLLVVVVLTAAALFAGVYLTFKSFWALDHPPVEKKPASVRRNPHDAETTAQLRVFFDGKTCAACGRPIQPMRVGDLRPGLLNVTTHQAITWHDIPPTDLSTTLASHSPICSNCVVLETFRHQHAEMIVDRHRIGGPDRAI